MSNLFVDAPDTREGRVVQRTIELVAGGILLLFGVVLLGFAGWGFGGLAWASIRLGTLPPGGAFPWTVLACLLTIAVFATQVGFRLVWNRPNTHGSLLSPAVWATLAFVFVGIGLASSIAMVRSGREIPIGLDFGFLMFALPCLLVARHLRRRSRGPL